MNILMIGWGFPPRIQGGLDTHVYELARRLAKSDSVTLTLPEFNSPKGDTDGIRIIPIRCREFSGMKSMIGTVKEYNENIVKACADMEPDVVHVHDWFGVEAAEALRKLTGKPWVFTLHSLEYMRSGNDRKSFMRALEKRGVENSNGIITVSKLMRNEISRAYGVPQEKIGVIYNSSSLGKGDPKKIREGLGLGNRPVALFLGRLSGQKAPGSFLAAARKVVSEFPDARFLMVGDGDLRQSLQKFSYHLGLDKNVIFTGFVPEDDIPSYYTCADVYAMPSVHEPFGITALESLMAGTPAIVSENAGVLENIPAMDCVRKIRSGDSAGLAKEIAGILTKRIRVTESERAILLRAYSWERAAAQTLKAYQSALLQKEGG